MPPTAVPGQSSTSYIVHSSRTDHFNIVAQSIRITSGRSGLALRPRVSTRSASLILRQSARQARMKDGPDWRAHKGKVALERLLEQGRARHACNRRLCLCAGLVLDQSVALQAQRGPQRARCSP